MISKALSQISVQLFV